MPALTILKPEKNQDKTQFFFFKSLAGHLQVQANSFSLRQQEIRIFFSKQGFQLLQLNSRIFIVRWNTKQSANLQEHQIQRLVVASMREKATICLEIKKQNKNTPHKKCQL